jgi:hypothetical protein
MPKVKVSKEKKQEQEKAKPTKKNTTKKTISKSAKPIKSQKLTFKEYNERRIAFVNQIDFINEQINKLELELLASSGLQSGQIVTVRDMPGEFVVVQVQRKFNANLVAVMQKPSVEVFEGAIDSVSQNPVGIEVLLREITGVVGG